jgi:hypothetical protein
MMLLLVIIVSWVILALVFLGLLTGGYSGTGSWRRRK